MTKKRAKVKVLIIAVLAIFISSPKGAIAQGYNIEMYSSLVAKVGTRLGLTGESAGEFAAIVIKNQGYRGFEAGKIVGALARESNATGKETEQILAVVS